MYSKGVHFGAKHVYAYDKVVSQLRFISFSVEILSSYEKKSLTVSAPVILDNQTKVVNIYWEML